MDDIYNPKGVKRLFDEMSKTYGLVNYISSFGFTERWRRQCITELSFSPKDTVYDLMSGMGELALTLEKANKEYSSLTCIDFSEEMSRQAEIKTKSLDKDIKLLQEDIFKNSLPDKSCDIIVSSFGLKTFSQAQQLKLVEEIDRLLKPGGRFSIVEISVPKSLLLKALFMFYLNFLIPVIGRIFLGNPQNYKMLGTYTEEFGDSSNIFQSFYQQDFEVMLKSYFFGCATGIVGKKKTGSKL